LAFNSGREADHSPPSSAGVKEWVELYLHSPNTPSWRGAWLGGAHTGVKRLTMNSILGRDVPISLFTITSNRLWDSPSPAPLQWLS
jgi:hypothetical protein